MSPVFPKRGVIVRPCTSNENTTTAKVTVIMSLRPATSGVELIQLRAQVPAVTGMDLVGLGEVTQVMQGVSSCHGDWRIR